MRATNVAGCLPVALFVTSTPVFAGPVVAGPVVAGLLAIAEHMVHDEIG